MRKTIQCPLLYLIAIHLITVIAIVAMVALWFGVRVGKGRVNEASVLLVQNGWWGDEWKEFAGNTGGWGSGGLSLDPLRERYIRVNDIHGNIASILRFDAQGELNSICVIPPGLMTAWWFVRSGQSTSGWSVSAWVTDNPEIHRSPNAIYERFTQYRDMNATGMPTERYIRTAPYPAAGRRFRLGADAWEEFVPE